MLIRHGVAVYAEQMYVALRTAWPVWLVGAISGSCVLWLAFADALIWLPVALAGSILLSFVIQLGARNPKGFLNRVSLNMTGLFLLFAVFTAIRLSISTAALGTIVG